MGENCIPFNYPVDSIAFANILIEKVERCYSKSILCFVCLVNTFGIQGNLVNVLIDVGLTSKAEELFPH